MLNLFNITSTYKNKLISLTESKKITENKDSRHFPSPIREWNNSIYVYNKNSLNLIPSTTKSVTNVIKSYFNLYNKNLELKIRSKKLNLRLRRLSLSKYYISSSGFKHTNNKVLINLFVYNRQKINYLSFIKKLYVKTLLNRSVLTHKNINTKLVKKLQKINHKGLQAVKLVNKDRYLLIKAINSINNKKIYKTSTFINLSQYLENFYSKLIKKIIKRVKIYFFYKQLLYVNMSKLNYTYLQSLKNQLEKIYNKNVEFNLINLKRFYLNSDMLSEAITKKLTKSRKNMLKFMNLMKNKIKITGWNDISKNIYTPHTNLEEDYTLISPKKKVLLQNFIISNLKYRRITGFRLEAKGRLSKRFTASRSILKTKSKGGLQEIYSSQLGFSSVLLKGNLRSNIQFTKLSSKTRIGSFGIKGWVSGI